MIKKVVTIRGFIDGICYCFELKLDEITLLHLKEMVNVLCVLGIFIDD